MQARPATFRDIETHQLRRQRKIRVRRAMRRVVDAIFPGVDLAYVPDNWQPPVDNAVRLRDYQDRINRAFDKAA